MHIYIGCISTQQELRTVYAKFHDAARDKSEIELHNYLQDKAWVSCKLVTLDLIY